MKQTNINSKKKPKNKKSKTSYQDWLDLTEKIIDSYRTSLFSFKKKQKQENKDQNIEICKAILKKFFDKKFSYQEAYSVAQISITDSQKIQKNEIAPVLIFFLGGLLMLCFSIFFLWLRFPRELALLEAIKTPHALFWLGSILVFSIVFFLGIRKRSSFERKAKTLSFLGQASSAYSFAKSPGHGGNFFEAVSYLYKIKAENEQNSPLKQIKRLFKK